MKAKKTEHFITNVKAVLLIDFPIINSPVSVKSYYVAVNGSDSYTSTQPQNINTPWATIQKAVTMVNPGDIVYIRGGVYKPATNIGSGNLAERVNYVTYFKYANYIT